MSFLPCLYFSFIFSMFIVSCLNYPENSASLLRVVYQLITSKPIFFVTLAFSLSFFLNYLLNNFESNLNYFIELQNNFHIIPELVTSITVVISPLCIFMWETLLKLSFWYFAQLYFHAYFYLAAYICKVNVSLSIHSFQLLNNSSFFEWDFNWNDWLDIQIEYLIFDVLSDSTKHDHGKYFIVLEDNCDSITGKLVVSLSPITLVTYLFFCFLGSAFHY